MVAEIMFTGLTAAIVKSGKVKAANVNIAVALCLISPEVPMIATR